MKWLLIAVMYGNSGGIGGGYIPSLAFHEFQTERACKAAADGVMIVSGERRTRAHCIAVGDDQPR